jgi:hypothetical protein
MAPRLLGSPPFGSWAFVIWPTLANKGHESDGKTLNARPNRSPKPRKPEIVRLANPV